MTAPDPEAISLSVRRVLLAGVLAGQDPAQLEETTPLLTSGVLDSIRTVKLIGDLEADFGVSFEAFEMSVDHLDTIREITATICGKLSG